MANLEEGEIVFCTVDKIIGTTVFVNIDNNGDGSLSFSEVAAGRIRNIRDYVVPKKKIICKILRISPNGHIDLSLRRVTQKETKELKEKYKHEKSYKSILKTVLGEKADKIIKEISSKYSIYEFLEEAKEDAKALKKFVGKETDKILDILKSQKKKKVVVKKYVQIISKKPNGLELIKDIFKQIKDVKIKYLSAGKYTLEIEAEDPKTADNQLKNILSDIEKKAKKQSMEFSIQEK